MSNFQKNVTNKNFLFEPNVKIKDELVLLINILNDEIKSYFLATKQIILKSKEGINTRINYDYINLIEKQLHLFIQKAKDLFKKMKYVKRQNCFQQQTEKNNNNNQLYNYCNNNFFYYSNAPLATNTNDYNRAMPIFICRLQILFARRQKCVSVQKAGARSLEDLPSAKIHNLSDFSKQIKKKYLQKKL